MACGWERKSYTMVMDKKDNQLKIHCGYATIVSRKTKLIVAKLPNMSQERGRWSGWQVFKEESKRKDVQVKAFKTRR